MSHKTAKATVTRQRTFQGRIAVWVGIAALIFFVLIEWSSQRNYESSLTALEGATHNQRLPFSEAAALVHGYAFRGDEHLRSDRMRTFQWPSVFKKYKLGLVLGPDDSVTAVTTFTGPGSSPADTRVEDPKTTALSSHPKTQTESPRGAKSVPAQPAAYPTGALPKGAEHKLALATTDLATRRASEAQGTLSREIIRQAVLISARDELGLATWDNSLGETALATAGANVPCDVRISVSRNTPADEALQVEIKLVRKPPESKPIDWTAPRFKLSPDDWLISLVERAEILSRDEFPKGLRAAGFEPAPKPTPKPGTTPESELDESHLDFVAQFAQLRRLHSIVRQHGNNPERMGALARCYANLGQLTKSHWSPASKTFMARALLYAQRSFVGFGGSPISRANRAYARALAGLHRPALEDLREARSAAESGLPQWVPLIEAYCAYKPEVLAAESGRFQELAAFLDMQMCDPQKDADHALQIVNRFAELNSACFQTTERLSDFLELGTRRMVAEVGYDRLWPRIYGRLGQIPDLPPAAHAIAEREQPQANNLPPNPFSEQTARLELVRALRGAGAADRDREEPSWTVLAELLRDASFLQAWRTVQCDVQWLGLPPEPATERVKLLIEGHRYQPFIESFSSDQKVAVAAAKKLLDAADNYALELPAEPLLTQVYQKVGNNEYQRLKRRMGEHADLTHDDLMRGSQYVGTGSQVGKVLLAVSPYRPDSASYLITNYWDSAKRFAPEWEKTFQSNPLVLKSLADRYMAESRPLEAERCVRQSLQVAPNFEAYDMLAGIQASAGEDEAAIETLHDALKLESRGLNHAHLLAKLAHIYMDRGEWKTAAPLAETAAQSFSGEGLSAAARCMEGLGNWSAAEQIVRAISERYETSSARWYFWCARTGRGDLENARQLAETYWKTHIAKPEQDFLWERCVHMLLQKDVAAAEQQFRESFRKYRDRGFYATLALSAAILEDELGQIEARDKLFEQFGPEWKPFSDIFELADLCQRTLREGGAWDRRAFTYVVEANTSSPWIYYWAGRFLLKRDPELAREYLQAAATSPQITDLGCVLANVLLREQGETVGATRLTRFPEPMHSQQKTLLKCYFVRNANEPAKANAMLREILDKQPDCLSIRLALAQFEIEQDDYAGALSEYEEAIRQDPESDVAHRALAWVLATCKQDDLRNGTRAVEHAHKAVSLRAAKTWLDDLTLAAAYAESGDFAQAIKHQELVLQRKVIPEFKDQLKLYRDHKPKRDDN